MRAGLLGRLWYGARRPRVTVCIPAYRSGAAIAETLASVQAQRFARFRVVVGVEPTGPDALDPNLRRAFARDPRFCFVDNARVLGWAGNVAALIAGVETEYFAVLPHDDQWHEDYLGTLVAALDAAPEAVLAFSDMQRFGWNPVGLHSEFDNADVSARLLSFYARGAEGHGWRGVVRRSRSDACGSFPQNRYLSFAVECEYMQAMLLRGAALRVPEALYKKRGYAPGAGNVSSRWRRELGPDAQVAALEHHRRAMLAAVPDTLTGQVTRAEVIHAAEVAMWHRGIVFASVNPEVAARMRAQAGPISEGIDAATHARRQTLRAMFDRTLSQLPPG